MVSVPITEPQLKEFQRLAKKVGVGRDQFQAARANGKLVSLIESLKPGLVLAPLEPPQGARLHPVRIRFKPDRHWREAIYAGGPDTHSTSAVWNVGTQYPPSIRGEVEEGLILLNYPNGEGNWDLASAWAREKKLEKTQPREVFALGEQYPRLAEQLRVKDPVYAMATTPCSSGGYMKACEVWWIASSRGADIDAIGDCHGSLGWFAFRKVKGIHL